MGAAFNTDNSADDYTGNISGFTATVSGTTVNFTWSYQGSAGFELEEEDQSDAGTNYAWIQSPTGRSASVGGLNPGDNYSFRARADRSDGTASDYVTASASIPATPTQAQTGASDPTLPAPSITGYTPDANPSPGYGGGTAEFSAPDNPADPNGTDGYYWQRTD
jgi:hypothetical protein